MWRKKRIKGLKKKKMRSSRGKTPLRMTSILKIFGRSLIYQDYR
jgi:hypothetical protein